MSNENGNCKQIGQRTKRRDFIKTAAAASIATVIGSKASASGCGGGCGCVCNWRMLCDAPVNADVQNEADFAFPAGCGNPEISATLVLQISTTKIADPCGTLPYIYAEYSDIANAYIGQRVSCKRYSLQT